MKFTLGWLKEHLETDATLDEILDRLTMVGLEVEGVEDRAKGLETFVTAKVIEARRHPNADRLRICEVFTGAETVELVCGAPNARTGMIGVYAPVGSYIPGSGVTLKAAEIRGVTSSGMLLSEYEMGLSGDHDGVVELDRDVESGLRAVDVMGLADPVIDIAITPNRGDCLGVRGVARDLAASGLGALKPLRAEAVPGAFESPLSVALDFPAEKASACPKFVGRYFRGIKNGPSPKWLRDRLTAIGSRPISALVDVTNLITLEYGRPLHVFDADKITGAAISARLGVEGETMEALNGETYTLDGEMTVIADGAGPEAIAGVIGGNHSGCTEETTNVFLEVAYFDPVRTAMTGRKLNVQTDARFRFERAVDPEFLEDGAEIASRLILELCGGEASNIVSAGSGPEWRRAVDFRMERVWTLGGAKVEDDEIRRILGALGFEVTAENGGALTVAAPSWRPDIKGEADLVEEVVRIYGYDKIQLEALTPPAALPRPILNSEQRRRANARRALAARGLIEAVTYSFLPKKNADLFGGVAAALELVNPISADLGVMRPSVLPNLLEAQARNAARGFGDGAFFEIGPQFSGAGEKGQQMVAAGVRAGQACERHWAGGGRGVDAYDAKADVVAVLEELGLPASRAQISAEADGWYHPGRSAVMRLGPMVMAQFGEVHPAVVKALGPKGPVVAFEIYLDKLPKAKPGKSAAKGALKLSGLQPVKRDFAFLVDADVAAGRVLQAAAGADKALVSNVSLFDIFEGEGVGGGKKSIAINVQLQPVERTLTDADLEAVSEKIVAAVTKATGGELRR